jgi:hypothetical protein
MGKGYQMNEPLKEAIREIITAAQSAHDHLAHLASYTAKKDYASELKSERIAKQCREAIHKAKEELKKL